MAIRRQWHYVIFVTKLNGRDSLPFKIFLSGAIKMVHEKMVITRQWHILIQWHSQHLNVHTFVPFLCIAITWQWHSLSFVVFFSTNIL